jgi:hypothetical protein
MKSNCKTLKCRGCGEEVHNVGEHAVSVLCWKCVDANLRNAPYRECEDEPKKEEDEKKEDE